MSIETDKLQQKLDLANQRIAELELLAGSKNTANTSTDMSFQKPDEMKFKKVIDASPVPYALNDEHQNIIYLNPAFVNTFGYDISDIPTLNDWWPKAYPDQQYRQNVSETWNQHLQQAIQTQQPFEPIEITITCKDGTSRNVMASAGSLSGMYDDVHLVILYDITDRIESEQALNKIVNLLENIVNSTPDLIFVKNTELKTIFCNEAFARAIGKSRDQLYGATDIENGWNPEHVNGNPELGIRGYVNDDLLALSGENVHVPHEQVNVQGETRIYDTHKMPLRDSQGEIVGMLGVARDITTRKKSEELLRRTQKMDALGKLTGGIAHDFNNLLGIILGYTELIQITSSLDSKTAKQLLQIHNAADRARVLTTKLLSFSRSHAFDAKSVNINDVLLRDSHMLETTLTAKINLALNLQDGLWQTFIDQQMLAESILNITINAMHAMPSGGELKISTENVHLSVEKTLSLGLSPGDYIALQFVDNGCGMSKQTKDTIFEPFYTTKGDAGTGLGMSQVYGFVKQSKGDVFIDSVEAKGTSVTIYLPRLNNVSIEPIEPQSSVTPEKVSGNETILVVEDEAGLRQLAQEILEMQGYNVLSAEGGTEALALLETESVDLMLSDVIMPGMDGYQLATRARDIRPELKIQLISGYSDKHFINNPDPVLKNQLLKKPYTGDLLLKKIRSLLDDK